MSVHREERGLYLIEASAFQMPGGNMWQPTHHDSPAQP